MLNTVWVHLIVRMPRTSLLEQTTVSQGRQTGTSKGEEDQARQKAGLQRYWTVTKWSGLTLGESKLLKVENKFA